MRHPHLQEDSVRAIGSERKDAVRVETNKRYT